MPTKKGIVKWCETKGIGDKVLTEFKLIFEGEKGLTQLFMPVDLRIGIEEKIKIKYHVSGDLPEAVNYIDVLQTLNPNGTIEYTRRV